MTGPFDQDDYEERIRGQLYLAFGDEAAVSVRASRGAYFVGPCLVSKELLRTWCTRRWVSMKTKHFAVLTEEGREAAKR